MTDRTRRGTAAIFVLAMMGATAGYACSDDKPAGTSGSPTPAGPSARAVIAATGTVAVSGTVDFVDDGAETKVTITLTGAPPGEHGMHIHQNGSCDPVDGGAGLGAGGHWNPADSGHGYPTGATRHLGDLGNFTAGADGKISATFTSKDFYVHDGPNSVIGHAVIFHEKKDDGSQPVGNAGGRPGCGIISKTP